jgi:hypothetical protein
LTGGNIPQESTVRASKRQALQLAHGLDFLSIQAYRLWMEYPSREKMSGLWNCRAKHRHSAIGGLSGRAFGPYCRKRA